MKTKIIILLCALAFWGTDLWSVLRAQETVPQTQTILKSYFVTGNVPTQTNYMEFIDTMFFFIQTMATNAWQMASNAQVIAASGPRATIRWQIIDYAGAGALASDTNNVSTNFWGYTTSGSGASLTYIFYLTNFFRVPFQDTLYFPLLLQTPFTNVNYSSVFTNSFQATNYFILKFVGKNGDASWTYGNGPSCQVLFFR